MKQETFMEFYAEWLKSDRKLRLGQAFINEVYNKKYRLEVIHDHELFYEVDYNKAFSTIVEKYLD